MEFRSIFIHKLAALFGQTKLDMSSPTASGDMETLSKMSRSQETQIPLHNSYNSVCVPQWWVFWQANHIQAVYVMSLPSVGGMHLPKSRNPHQEHQETSVSDLNSYWVGAIWANNYSLAPVVTASSCWTILVTIQTSNSGGLARRINRKIGQLGIWVWQS